MIEHKKYTFDFTTEKGKKQIVKDIDIILNTNDRYNLVKILYTLLETVSRHEIELIKIKDALSGDDYDV